MKQERKSGKSKRNDYLLCRRRENIWSIAKRYNTSLSAVMEENGLEEEILPEKQIVLIPMIG